MVITKFAAIANQTIVIKVSKELTQQADWFLSILYKMHENGDFVLEDGRRIQFGWSSLVLRRIGASELQLFEPDYFNDPFSDEREDISCSLKNQADQVGFANRAGVTPVFTKFQDKIILEKDSLSSNELFMSRSHPNPEKFDSGWFIGVRRQNEAQPDLDAIYCYQLLKLRPELFPALILPEGFMVFFSQERIEGVLNSDNQIIMQ